MEVISPSIEHMFDYGLGGLEGSGDTSPVGKLGELGAGDTSPVGELYDRPEPERRRVIAERDRRIGELASHINAAHAELLLELGDFVSAGGWADHGAKTPEEWVGWRCGITTGDARHFVRIAQRLPELPMISAAFTTGRLSYWQVRAMTPIATPEIEERLLMLARYCTASQLQRLVRAYKGCLDRAELDRANERHAQRGLDYHFDEDGFLVVRGRLSPEDGAVFRSALEAAADQIRDELPDDPGEPLSWSQVNADALVELARRSQAADGDGGTARVPEILVHVDLPSLIEGSGERCEIGDGPVLASETVRRLSCDAEVQAIFEDGDKALDLGRKKRSTPPRLRRALEQRDLTCRFPGCNRRRFRHAHHVRHWTRDKGTTKPANLMLLCSFHHRLVHEGGYTVVGNPDGEVDFVMPDGTLIPRVPDMKDGSPHALITEHERRKLPIDDRTCTTLWDGEKPNYADCVDALLSQTGMLALPKRGSP